VKAARYVAAGVASVAAGAGVVALAVDPNCFDVRKVSETASTITLGWDRQDADGYRFYRNDVPVSRTFDPSRTTARFSKPGTYRIEVLKVTSGISGVYPEAP
jgi:hypothetical protein